MVEPFLAEIRVFPYSFPPTGWAFCNGQLMPLSQNTALFALLETTYGGDGKATFALPNLQGAAPMGAGQGPGLTARSLGDSGGSDTVTLEESEIPVHTHTIQASGSSADLQSPGPARVIARSSGGNAYNTSAANLAPLAAQAISSVGGGLPHNNLQPYLTLNFCIALQGAFPPHP